MKNIFEDTQIAFSLKSDTKLQKAYLLFKMMSYPRLVTISSRITRFMLHYKFPVKNIIRATIFEQFCGGTTEEECLDTMQQIYSMNVHTILDYSVEDNDKEEEFDIAMEEKCNLIAFSEKHQEIAFAVVKPTAIGRFAIWQAVSEKKALSPEEKVSWEKITLRMDTICKKAHDANVPLLIDAEESWMQDAADELALEMMKKYNKEHTFIFNTIQCYRHDRMAYIGKLHETARNQGFKIGAKIVRGAYMEKENKRAIRKGYPTPICENKSATDHNFNTILKYIIENNKDFSLFIGSHNEKSNYLALELMASCHLAKNDNRIWYGQLYGMSDHLSFNLGKHGYNVAKLVPFGPIKEVIPYLIRRAEENTSVAGQTGRELTLIKQEIQRRKQIKKDM